MTKHISIEQPMRRLLTAILPLIKFLISPVKLSLLLTRRWSKVREDLIVVKLQKYNKNVVEDICSVVNLKKDRVVFTFKTLPKKIKIKKNILFIQKDTVNSRLLTSRAKAVIFTDRVDKLPRKKPEQIFAYIGEEKLPIHIDRKIDIKLSPRREEDSFKSDVKKILYLKDLDKFQKFQLLLQSYPKKEAFRRAGLKIKDLIFNDLFFDWLRFYISDVFDFNLRKCLRAVLSKHSHWIPVDKELVVVYNNFNQFSCNIKYIVKELSQEGKWKIVYLIRTPDENLNTQAHVLQVDPRSVRAIFLLCRAKIWIYNSIKPPFEPRKKENQIFIQTWHGSLGIKRVDPEFIYDKVWLEKAKANNDITDICISNSAFETQMYKTSYWSKAIIWEIGHPRNDILLKDTTPIRTKICCKYSIDPSSVIFLYAPTYREDYDSSMYLTDFNEIKIAIQNRYKKPVTILVRYHHWFIRRAPKHVLESLANSGVIDVSDHPDMQEILATTDIGCTDYSSWIYDFILTRRPGFIYAPDVEKYLQFRGFYYPITETPFPVAKNIFELTNNIQNFQEQIYRVNVENFLKDRGCIEMGNATSKFIEKLKEMNIHA